jgi:predicted RNase H-like HicB family nuclease
MKFVLVLHSDDGVSYGVTVPDLAGCFSHGDSLDEAIESAKESIDFHIEGLVEMGMEIPISRSIVEHRTNPDYADAVWSVVDVDVRRFEGKSEKINITLPKRLLVQIDTCAKARGKFRSGFLAEAARHALA